MNAGEIREVAEGALAWVSAHRDHFALGDDALAADGEVDRTWKPLGELAQVCATVTRRTPPADPLHTRASDLLAFAWRQTGQGELFLRMQHEEPFATYPLEVYAAFAAAGLRHPGYEASAAKVARTRSWRLTEQDPTRRLGVLAAERRGHLDGHPPAAQAEHALRRTWLGGLPEPWTFEVPSGYALTHVVFHLTDWGRADRGVPPDLAAYLTQWLPPWLDTCGEARMWDLTCELLAVAASVPGPAAATGSRDVREAWRRIAAAQDGTGGLPEVGGAGPGRVGTSGGDTAADPGEDFTFTYHSTLMAAFAATLTIGHPGTPRTGGVRPDALDGRVRRPAPARYPHGGQGALG
ncbi:hypothetical protein SUDANB58_05381 [Streptomyces sp. enrichment culture]|uniref:DUF6895 family protein n=1 Tax=Streptomyces sp. enrichment culture TaxID=1795815 RepID=UPI003F545167